jgi:hypothetical protein
MLPNRRPSPEPNIRHFDTLRSGTQVCVRPTHLNCGIGMRLVNLAPAQCEIAFLDARLVTEAVEKVPAQSDGNQPVGPTLIVKNSADPPRKQHERLCAA